MPYSITTKDGITINNIPDDVPPDSQALKDRVTAIRSGQAPGVASPGAPVEAAPETTAAGVAGAANRALAPYAASAVIGPEGPAILGAAKLIGDPLTQALNSLLGALGVPPQYHQISPSQAIEMGMDKLGMYKPRTPAERVVQAGAEAAGGGLGGASLGRVLVKAEAPVAAGIGKALAAQPAQQIVGGAGAGIASQTAAELGGGPGTQFGAGLLGSMIGAKAAQPRTPIQRAYQLPDIAEAEKSGIKVMTTDIAPPETFASKWLQGVGEKIPIAGTGGLRKAQQAQRIEAVKNVLSEYGVGPGFLPEDASKPLVAVFNDLAERRSAMLSKYSSMKRDVINKLSNVKNNLPDGITEKDVASEDWPKIGDAIHKELIKSNERTPKLNEEINFIRYGKPVKRSVNHMTGDQERGMSVYSLNEKGAAEQTVRGEFSERQTAYIGKGKVVGYGSDGEPLVDNVRNIRKATNAESDKAEYYGLGKNNWMEEIGYNHDGTRRVPGGISKRQTVPVPKTTAAIDAEINRLASMKNKDANKVIDVLTDWKTSIQDQGLSNVEALRAQIGQSFESPDLVSARDLATKSLSGIYKFVREDMGDFIKATGQKNDYTKWAVANKRLSEMAGEVETGALRSVLKSGQASPEDVSKMLFSAKPSEVKRLVSGLTPTGRENAKMAVIARVAEQSGGIENLSPEKFITSARKLGGPIGVVFDAQEAERIRGLSRALQMTAQASKAALSTPTGMQGVPIVGTALLTDLFGGAGAALGSMATYGAMARMYESKLVRDTLMRLPKTKPGSPEEAALFKRLIAATQAQENSKKENQ